MSRKISLELIGISIKRKSVPTVRKAFKSQKDPELAEIGHFLSLATLDEAGDLAFKTGKENDDPYGPWEDGTTIAKFGTWDEHKKIASWVKHHTNGGKMVLFSCDGDGAAWGWEFDGEGRMRELKFRYLGLWK